MARTIMLEPKTYAPRVVAFLVVPAQRPPSAERRLIVRRWQQR